MKLYITAEAAMDRIVLIEGLYRCRTERLRSVFVRVGGVVKGASDS